MEAWSSFSRFLDFQLAPLGTEELIATLVESAGNRARPMTVGYLNAAQVNLAFESREFAAALDRMDLLYADGQSVVWAARWLGTPVAERVTAADFAGAFAAAAGRARLRLALIGGKPDESGRSGPESEAGRAAGRLLEWGPGLEICLVHHGYLPDANAERALLTLVEAADPDLVLVGMGAPLQEQRVLRWRGQDRGARVWWCVGALFEFIAGTRARAPAWMRRSGLEWSYRLLQEPTRLWRRYLLGNPRYLAHLLRGRPPPGVGCAPP